MVQGFEAVKKVALFLFFGLVTAFFVVVYFIDTDSFLKRPDESFVVEGTYVRIVKKNKLRWEVWAEDITVDAENEIHRINNIYNGIYYRHTKPPFTFHADGGIYNAKTEEVHLDGNIEFVSENGDSFSAEKVDWYGKPERVTIPVPLHLVLDGNTYTAGEMNASGENLKEITLKKNVIVEIPDAEETASEKDKEELEETGLDEKYLKKLVLKAEVVEYTGEPEKFMRCYPATDWKVIHIPGEEKREKEKKVELEGKEFRMKSHELYIDFKKKMAHPVGDVWMLRKAEKKPEEENSDVSKALKKKDTIIETEDALYYWKDGKVQIPDRLEMFQKGRDLVAGKGFVNTKSDTAFLSEGVTLHQHEKAKLVEEGIVEEDASDKVKEISNDETWVTCEMMDVDFESENLDARGDVYVKQEKRNLRGMAATYVGEEGVWTVFGSPVIHDEEGMLTADIMFYHEDENFFEALGKVTAELAIKKDDHESIEDFYRERGDPVPKLTGDERAVLYSDRLEYDEENDVVFSGDRTTMIYREMQVEADTMRVDQLADFATGTGNVIITDPHTRITADSFVIDGEKEVMQLTGEVVMKELGRPATDDLEEKKPYQLHADFVEYEWEKKKGAARGNVLARSGDGTRWVAANEMNVDRERKFYTFTGDVRFHQDNGEWLTEEGVLDDQDEKTKKVAQKTTDVTCRRAEINDAEDIIRFEEEVVITQPEKKLRADIVEVDSAAERFSAFGNVYLEQSSGNWLFDDGFVAPDADDEAKKKLRGRIQAQTDMLESLYGEKKILMNGNVKIYQGADSATADRMWHYGETDRTILEGGVKIVYDGGRKLNAEKVVYDGENDVVEAFKSITASSDVKESDAEEKK